MSVICRECGHENCTGTVYCENCGNPDMSVTSGAKPAVIHSLKQAYNREGFVGILMLSLLFFALVGLAVNILI